MTRIAAYVPDLMDRSRVSAVADVTFVARPADLVVAGADVVVVDLGRPGVIEVLSRVSAAGARTVGFASHVDTELIEAARAAGCDEVLPRSKFFAQIPRFLGV